MSSRWPHSRWPGGPGRPRGAAAVVVLAAALVAGACGSGDDGAGAGDGGGRGDRRVVLLTYDSFALPDEAAAAFRRETGATIEVRTRGDSGSVLAAAQLSAGAPEGDVIFGIDGFSASRVDDELLEPHTPAAAADLPEALQLPGELGRLLTPIDRGDVCVNVDAEWFAERSIEPPVTFADLTQDRYRDLLVVPSPVTSSPGLAFLVGTVAATDDWGAYWQRLEDNGVRVRPSWDDAWSTDYSVSGGDRPLVVSYATSPPAEVLLGEEGRTEPRSTVATGTCVGQVEYAGVLRGTSRPALARRLVDFLLSDTWQAALPAANFVLPAVPGTPVPPEFERFVPEVEPVRADPIRVGREREAWIERWRSIME